MKKALITFTVILFVFVTVYAQESINATGGNAHGSGGTVAYSIGQIVYTAHSGHSGTVAQGVQHGYEIIPVGIKESLLNISLSIFPNPTSDYLTLQIKDYNSEKLSLQLLDIQGRLRHAAQIYSGETVIHMNDLAKATYFIHVFDYKSKKIQSFKIVKL